ncbi:MAG: radical SAM protein [Planctomycetota bacterium]
MVVVRVNTQCALGCRYCGFSREVHRARPSIDVASLHRFAEALSELRQRSGRTVLVSLLGGEPFQWSAWEPVSERLGNLGLRVSATTNGLALEDPRIAERAIRLMQEITISIDGERDHHDTLRSMPGLFDRLERIVRSIAARRIDRQPLLRVNSVLTRTNIGNFEAFAHLMADWGVDQLTFNQLGGNDRPSFYPENRLLEGQVKRFREDLPRWQSDLQQRGLELCGSEGYLHRIACTARNQTIAIDDCQPATRFLFVDEFGRASPCNFTSDALGVPIDQLTTAESIESLPEHWRRQRSGHRPKVCADCHATHVHAKFVAIASNR